MREADANETSGELGVALLGSLVGVSQLRMPKFELLIKSTIWFQEGWYPVLQELDGGI